jgi:two-component system sensor histidine kinase KdpD
MTRRTWMMWIGWSLALLGATLVLFAFRERLERAHVVLVFLLIILGASAAGGRVLGIVLSLVAFLVFDLGFLPPYGTLVVRDPLDWLVLVTFLVTSVVAAQLLYTARAQRAAAEREAAAREGTRMKDALLAAVSHDLRTPLTSIKGLAHELAQDGDERAAIIEEEADRLNRLVTELLDAARVSTGTFPVNPQPNALDDLLGAVTRQFAGRADSRRLVAALDQPSELVIGMFDFVQTLRVVTNLVENAFKYSPLDSEIGLNGGAESGRMVIRVSDRGAGLPSDDARNPHVDGVQPRAGMSTGLGLTIARGLTEAQHGTIEYQPRAGGGSVFILSLPLASR